MSFLKCEVGKPLVLLIDDVAYNQQGKFGVQTVFIAGNDSFTMNPESAAKQLAHADMLSLRRSPMRWACLGSVYRAISGTMACR